jgi:SAM-dependent methyltransferase
VLGPTRGNLALVTDHAAVTFPPGFFERSDERDDAVFYGPPRLVQHIDEAAVTAVSAYYDEVGVDGDVLDLMASWVSHLSSPPRHLTVLGLNTAELGANTWAHERVVHDLNTEPRLPFTDATFDTVISTVSVDYLTSPVEVFRDVARVLRPGGTFAVTFSNRCFPTKAIRGWLATDDAGHRDIVASYFRASGAFDEPVVATRPSGGDPVSGVSASRM